MKRQEKSYVIFGVGKFGRSVAEELTAAGMNVLAVDDDKDKISAIADSVTMAVVADVNDTKEIESLGLENFDAAIIATTGNLSASVMGLLQAKDAGIPFILAKASDEMQAKAFKRLGADKVVIPEQESAARIARTLIMGGYLDLIELSDTIRLAEIPTKKEWIGKNLKELNLRGRYHLNVAAVRAGDDLTVNWSPDAPLPEKSSLLVIADKAEFEKLEI